MLNKTRDILNNIILEKWNPSNKKKHSACKARVKAKVKVWPSAYASAQVVQCYYGKNIEESLEMKNLLKLFERSMPEYKNKLSEIYYESSKEVEEDCDCGSDLITEKKRGSPWFRHKDTDALIPRKHEGRSYLSKAQMAEKKRIGDARIKKFLASGGSLKAKAPNNPAMTMEEVIWASATRTVLGKKAKTKKKKGKKKGGKTKFQQKMDKKASEKKRKEESVRSALKKIESQRKK